MKINSYKDLEAYKKGSELVKVIYKITKNFPKEETYGITSQIRRASVSIPSNIAEGYMRGSKEYIQFLKMALGSCAELETQLSLSKDLSFCNESDFNKVYGLNEEIIKLLRTYINTMTNRYTLNATR
jgi:four helix bundle protein